MEKGRHKRKRKETAVRRKMKEKRKEQGIEGRKHKKNNKTRTR